MNTAENTESVVAVEVETVAAEVTEVAAPVVETVNVPKAEYERLQALAQAKGAKGVRLDSTAQVGGLTKAVGRYARELEDETESLRKAIAGGDPAALARFYTLTDGLTKARNLLNDLRLPEARTEEAAKLAAAKEKQKAKLAEKTAKETPAAK